MVAIRWMMGTSESCSLCLRLAFYEFSARLPTRMFLRSIKSHPLNIILRHPRSFYKLDAHSMHRNITIDTSPPQARWMKDTFDRSAFHRTVPVLAARVPATKTSLVLKGEAMRGSAHFSPSGYRIKWGPCPHSRALFLMKFHHQSTKNT